MNSFFCTFFCTSKRDGGPAKRRFYKSEQAARDAMTRAIRNGAEWAEYGWGRHYGAGEFSVKTVTERKEAPRHV